ncbi:MAG: carboxypeptidase regulatory-like domain-containing protein [Candidatus Electryonea clarkiae]|nr:carboxypeptidase regulatory-like domain-containing protein [Candidatus Electryonea clarkiae]MDP8287902.1 carboxypeptidase regulatory-like domain-containing protein [Candidatus Electryonea clarkiae]
MKIFKATLIFSLTFVFTIFCLAEMGGPDNYGYRYIDSQEDDGPEFDWIDISNTGTEITYARANTTLGPYDISFDFEYYGTEYDQFWICSNGWISFSADQGTNRNISNIPFAGSPNNVLIWCTGFFFPYWPHGLQPHTYYGEDDDGNFIIQMDDWFEDNGGGRISTEIILKPYGDIIFQYESVDDMAFRTREVIGMENLDGSDGLEVSNYAEPEDYPFSELAILYSPRQENASVEGMVSDQTNGDPVENATLSFFGNDEYQVITDDDGYYYIEEMYPGIYDVRIEAELFVNLDETDLEVEEDENEYDFVLLHLASTWVDPEEIEFSGVIGADENPCSFTIGNSGAVVLSWELSFADDWLSANYERGIVRPENEFTITLNGDATDLDIGNHITTLTIYTNDPENLELIIPVVFIVDYDMPGSFILLEPANNTVFDYEDSNEIQFIWESSTDPDPRAYPTYTLNFLITLNDNTEQTTSFDHIQDTTFSVDLPAELELEFWEEALEVEWWVDVFSHPDTVQCEQLFRFTFEPNTQISEDLQEEIPNNFTISSVYPNPFNSSVNINFVLPQTSIITAEIVDILGNSVAVIQHGKLGQGDHSFIWQANDQPSGLYFIRIKSNFGISETNKMLLVK